MICTDVNQFDNCRFYLLTHKIKNTKPHYDYVLEKESCALKGSRYNDDNRIARTVVGYIYAECGLDIDSAKKKFLSLNSIEIEPYIEKAILDSARSDYYYTYEKSYE